MKRVRVALYVVVSLLLVLLLVVVGVSLWAGHALRASLAQVDGSAAMTGLDSRVLVKRDALGVPTIQGATRRDVARALGFVHAQERFFQMDLARRRAAGELSELFGTTTIQPDRAVRVHRFRTRARRIVGEATPELKAMLEAYTDGVNTGLAALGAKPFEYFVLRAEPAPWRAEDCILVVTSMFLVLQDSTGTSDYRRGLMYQTLPRQLAHFLAAPAPEWEAPVVGDPSPKVPLPGPEVFDLRASTAAAADRQASSAVRQQVDSPSTVYGLPSTASVDDAILPGSNNWVVSGAHTASGAAMVANDMHLAIGVPNTWYRASLAWTDGGFHRVTGVTLPGAPSVIVGSNGDIAWGFTNTEGDWSDLIPLDPDPSSAGRYLTPSGPKSFDTYTERIRVKDRDDRLLQVKETIWGPVVQENRLGRAWALRWVAHSGDGLNLRWAAIETARTIEEAFAVANGSGVPAQNLVVAERSGRIGWTVAGRIPKRVGFDGRVPVSWADGTNRWDGWLDPAEYPRIVDPAGGRIWTANQRIVSGEMHRIIGDAAQDQGARARQIRDDLAGMDAVVPRDMLRVQLDDRALFLERWRDLVLGELDPAAVAQSAARGEFRRVVEQNWTGRASIDSAGYRLVRAFRLRVRELALDPLLAPMIAADPQMSATAARSRITDGPLWSLVTDRPVHLLPKPYASWDALLVDAIDRTVTAMTSDGRTLASRTWGEVNTTRIRHPLGAAVPAYFAKWLDMPFQPLPGDNDMPRVQSPGVGASERFAVSPGHEDEGYFHMPGGQSGHPLSPNYRDEHTAWARGIATPFLPGRTVHVLTLDRAPRPEGGDRP